MNLIKNLFKKEDSHLSESEISIHVNNLRLDSLDLIPEKSRTHVQNCDECKNAVVEVLGFIDSQNIEPEIYSESASALVMGNSLNRMLPMIAAMLVLIIVPFSVYKYNTNESGYILNDDYEALLGSVFRSEKVELISPEIISEYSSFINFELSETPVELLYLLVYDVEENVVFETDFNSAEKILNLEIEDGIYYWKLESENDLIYMGKIIK
ncbi:MAG: hypothetical protein H8E72_02705 [Candidatus Marinimicrobia bacterium]|nr:hypothetical protein [Candidatus Neomarinimicrobiota bacterium]